MTKELTKPRMSRWFWIAGIVVVLCISVLVVCATLPTIACCGVKYEWSHDYSMDVLKWLGPRSCGALFEYHKNFKQEEWFQLLKTIFENINTEDQANLFVSSFNNVNVRGYENTTPIHWSSSWGHYNIVTMLIENGADVNSKDKFSRTPLHMAATTDKIHVVKLLIENGADINAQDHNGRTPLAYARDKVGSFLNSYIVENSKELNDENKK
jgi:hypothetical protein